MVKTANHACLINFLREKMEREQNYNNDHDDDDHDVYNDEMVVECPRSNDVVFRKGPVHKWNPGNMYYRELIESTNDKHSKASIKEKCHTTWTIVKEIEKRNGRFLEWSKPRELWIVTTDRGKIRLKVAAALKHYNRSIVSLQGSKEQHAVRKISSDNKQQRVSQQAKLQLSKLIENAVVVVEENSFTNALSTTEKYRVGEDNQNQHIPIIQPNGGSALAIATKSAANQVLHDDFLWKSSEDGRLKHYYSAEQHAYYSKRRKTTMFCEVTGSNDGDDSCFGRCYFPT